jgi:hypothetical protein
MAGYIIDLDPEEEADFCIAHAANVGYGKGGSTGAGLWHYAGQGDLVAFEDCTGFAPNQEEKEALEWSLRTEVE